MGQSRQLLHGPEAIFRRRQLLRAGPEVQRQELENLEQFHFIQHGDPAILQGSAWNQNPPAPRPAWQHKPLSHAESVRLFHQAIRQQREASSGPRPGRHERLGKE